MRRAARQACQRRTVAIERENLRALRSEQFRSGAADTPAPVTMAVLP
jgi:hypothetical protein